MNAVIVQSTEVPQIVAMPVPDYDADRTAVRKSWLDLVDKSPAHLNAYLQGHSVSTEAMFRGTLIHTFILEPDSVESRYYIEPDGDRRTNKWKEAAAEEAAKHTGKIATKRADYEMAIAVRDSVYRHKAARVLLGADGETERSVFWQNSDTGERCKARLDKLSTTKAFIADVKSTVDASPAAFAKSIVNYRYDCQADHYSEPLELRFVFIAVEKAPPYAVAVYAASDDVLAYGRSRRLPNLRTYAECKAKNEWPAYPQTIQRISLPRWAR
jgi:exodeoxyribonuclease VIII